MAHINHTRNVAQARTLRMSEVIPATPSNDSFGVFCGSAFQRNTVGLREIGRCCGSKGVVLVHNDRAFEERLGLIYQRFPQLRANFPRFQMFLANPVGNADFYYDPLYGLPASSVLDAIAPPAQDVGLLTDAQRKLRAVLSDYLSILNSQFQQTPERFGDYPYHLDVLLALTELPFAELETRVLRYLPPQLRTRLSANLSADGVQQQAFSAVFAFCQELSRCLWTRRTLGTQSRLSIIQAVKDKNLISIFVPNSQKEVLDYLSVELEALNNGGVSYLLVADGIDLNNSERFKNLFLAPHNQLPYATGILAEDTSTVVESSSAAQSLAPLFSQTQTIVVFQCSSTMAADPFSTSIGTYYRQVTEAHTGTHREFFHILPSGVDHGGAQREVQQLRVNPEELTALGTTGCLLCGKNYETPILVDDFILE
ncbi:MAG: hypothetical protein LUH42_08270 [Oscillospiraceae bacterium]|nr:hypothetical protein [Oscillospiraceae bacterium]